MAYFRALCTECGFCAKKSHDDKWLDPFFLPSRCPRCHAHKYRHGVLNPDSGWFCSYGELRPAPHKQPFSFLRPSTWFPAREWVDLDGETLPPMRKDMP